MDGETKQLVLIVDDNPTNVDVLYNLLSSAGFEVAVALDGKKALEQAGRDVPDLILLDVQMGDLDGFEVCRRLRANPVTADTPLIFMTASTDAESRLKGMRLGAVDYITKPFENEEVLARVQVHTSLRLLTRKLAEGNALLAAENRERAAAEAALSQLNKELEQRVEARTAELGRALSALELARAQLAATVEDLQKSNARLEREAMSRDEDLREARALIQRELAERDRQRAELQEDIISAQRASLAELSTPLIPITDRIMVMPMIGTIREERAAQMLETALAGSHRHGARVVILDVTGMKLVDIHLAGMLTRIANALRLLGAETVITGIGPELAQALVSQGIDLGAAAIRGTLQSGIVCALDRSGHSHALRRALSAQRR